MKYDQIEALVQEGKVIQAIKALRELEGCSLVQAKEAVDNFRNTGTWKVAEKEDFDLREIQDLLLQNKKIQAIKLYRQKRGASLKDAKEAVEEMEAQMNQSAPNLQSFEKNNIIRTRQITYGWWERISERDGRFRKRRGT